MSNSRILKNTLALYLRMLITMAVGLFTARVVLQALGVEDYGIYNLVGGFVAMFAFIRGSLQTAASRFFAFEIGRGDQGDVRSYFRSVFTLHLLIIPVLVILLETVGLFFLKAKLNIPLERMPSAMWAFHFSVFGTCLSVIQIPLLAMVIAHEKMGVYAYLSIFDAVLKVAVAVLVSYSPYDKLITYAALLMISPVGLTALFHLFCRRSFQSYSLRPMFERRMIRELFSYTGWSFWGSFAHIMKMQGVNILLNIFFGPVVNAARGIALQVNSMVMSFSQNFTMALNPQIIKNYSSNDLRAMFRLMTWGGKLSFFLLLFLSLPVLFEADFLLHLWLGTVPEHTVAFVQILLIDSLIGSFAYVMATSIQATGKIKLFQLVVGGLFLFNIPVSYVVLNLGFPPVSTAIVSVVISVVAMFARLWVLKRQIPQFPVRMFICDAIGPSVLVAISAIILPFYVKTLLLEEWYSFFASAFACSFSVICFIWLFGMSFDERHYVVKSVKARLKGEV
jgi:O-antigen/teichoic acid export membrane protein